jgi:hypothetical protein
MPVLRVLVMNEKKQLQQKDASRDQKDPNFRKRTDLPGQNPKANDDPSRSKSHRLQRRKS